jgi:hypothetical protein
MQEQVAGGRHGCVLRADKGLERVQTCWARGSVQPVPSRGTDPDNAGQDPFGIAKADRPGEATDFCESITDLLSRPSIRDQDEENRGLGERREDILGFRLFHREPA